MFECLDDVAGRIRSVLSTLDPALLSGADAAVAVRRFAEVERLAAVGKTLLAARVEETRAWDTNDRPVSSPAEWLADATGTTVGAAVGVFNTARDVAAAPAVADAVRDGALSVTQAGLVAGAARTAPEAVDELVALAQSPRSSVAELRNVCQQVKARAEDPAVRAARHHANRKAWFGTDPDGMVELRAVFPVATGATVRTLLEKRTDQIFRERNRAGTDPEPRDRYMCDALVELLEGGVIGGVGAGGKKRRSAPRPNVQIRVDLAALMRGYPVDDEVCDAPGAGELTVPEVQALLEQENVVIDALLTRGHDVLKVVRLDRYRPVVMQTGLNFRDPTCVVPGCTRHWRLEDDHTAPGGYAGTKRTQIDELGKMCDPHHELKTNHGWVLSGSAETGWSFDPPEPRAQGA